MKKLVLLLLCLSLPSFAYAKSYVDSQLKQVKKNVKYNSVQIHEKNYIPAAENIKIVASIKDPELIKLSDYKKVSEKDYEKKLTDDEQVYKKEIYSSLKIKSNSVNIEPYAIDFYKLYRITERLIRANNLDYANWRISVRKTDDVNAYSANINQITIYTGLYDTFYGDDDGLAFIIAHEMSHAILGHQEQDAELIRKIVKLEKAKRVGGLATTVTQKGLLLKYYKDLRNMEYMADTEAIILLTKAGYSPQKALAVLNSLDVMLEVPLIYNTHPIIKDRIESYKENMALINPEWVEEGKQNIYNSVVLPCKKSSDRVSFVISKSESPKDFYEVEDLSARLKRIAYMSYKNGNYQNSIKYFEKLSKLDESDYIPYVYIALSNYELYRQLKEQKYLEHAKLAIQKANNIHPNDAVISEIMLVIK